jgi:hypothetical protein
MAMRIRIERTATPASATRRRSLTVAAATGVAIVLLGGVSYAWWTAGGSGNATVGSLTAQPLTIAASSPAVSDMYPGKAKQALTFTVTNPNAYTVVLNASPTIGAAVSSDATACAVNATNLTVTTGPYTMTGTLTVTAGATVSLSVASFVQLPGTAGDGCQGKTFTFPVSVSGQQQ